MNAQQLQRNEDKTVLVTHGPVLGAEGWGGILDLENAVILWLVRTVMAARDHHQRTVVHVAVVEIDAGRQHVVVGVGVERPVLVPFDR